MGRRCLGCWVSHFHFLFVVCNSKYTSIITHIHPSYLGYEIGNPGAGALSGTLLVPGLALAGTRLVVELVSIALLAASAFAIKDVIEACGVNVRIVRVEGPASVWLVVEGEFDVDDDDDDDDDDAVVVVVDAKAVIEDEASTLDRSIPILSPNRIRLLLLSKVS
jgi:hypothetical protein